jgi:outer membrane protein OmpA-like peptidoglycan-associated protein
MPRLPAITWRTAVVLLAGLPAALLFTAPGWAQETTTIVQARGALEAARSTRAVRALAAPQLDAAEYALERALAALEAGQPRDEVEHLAYLAARRAAIARMHARQRRDERRLQELSATQALILEARALEAAAVEQRSQALAGRLKRFDVRSDREGLELTPREPWFETELAPSQRALQAIAEAARLLGQLPDREVVVLGYAERAMPRHGATPASAASDHQAGRGPGSLDLGCARADVVRALLISNRVDPRRIVASCVASPNAIEVPPGATIPATAPQITPTTRQTTIVILPVGGSAWPSSAGGAVASGPLPR